MGFDFDWGNALSGSFLNDMGGITDSSLTNNWDFPWLNSMTDTVNGILNKKDPYSLYGGFDFGNTIPTMNFDSTQTPDYNNFNLSETLGGGDTNLSGSLENGLKYFGSNSQIPQQPVEGGSGFLNTVKGFLGDQLGKGSKSLVSSVPQMLLGAGLSALGTKGNNDILEELNKQKKAAASTTAAEGSAAAQRYYDENALTEDRKGALKSEFLQNQAAEKAALLGKIGTRTADSGSNVRGATKKLARNQAENYGSFLLKLAQQGAGVPLNAYTQMYNTGATADTYPTTSILGSAATGASGLLGNLSNISLLQKLMNWG
jgi:hypothetical protein